MKSRIQKIFGTALTLFFTFFAIPFPVDALFFLGPLAVAAIAYAVLYILQYIGAMFFSLSGYLVGFFLDFNYQVLSPNNMVVTIGWEITRDIANLGFVLVIIIIALATIIRYQDYGAKKLLPRLIGAALLVNFSLSLAGVFIGFSHVITRYFFNAVAEKDNIFDLVETLSGAFDPQALFTEPSEPEPVDPDEEAGGLSGFGTAVLMNITGLFFVVIFTFTASFVLLAFALMLLIRYVALSFLMILAPIAWLFWVIPSLDSQFSKWWSKFLKWVFFAPAVSFFFYLALVSVGKMKQGAGAVTSAQFFKNGFLSAMMQQGARMAILIGLLIGGLIVADSMGTTGAKGAMSLLNKGVDKSKKWLGTKAKEGALRAGTSAMRTDTGQSITNRLQTLGTGEGWGSRNIGRPLAKAFGIHTAGRALEGLADRGRKQEEEAKEKLKGMSMDQKGRRFRTANDPEKNAIVNDFSTEARALADALRDADREIERATRARDAAEDSGDQNSIAAARERYEKAEDSRRDVQTKMREFETAMGNLPPETRRSIMGGGTQAQVTRAENLLQAAQQSGDQREIRQAQTNLDTIRNNVARIQAGEMTEMESVLGEYNNARRAFRRLRGDLRTWQNELNNPNSTLPRDQINAEIANIQAQIPQHQQIVDSFDVANLVFQDLNMWGVVREKPARRYMKTIEDEDDPNRRRKEYSTKK